MKQAAMLLCGLVAGVALGAWAVPGLQAQPAAGAYVVAEMRVTDPAGFSEYERREAATLAAYRGRVLTRGLPDVREGAGLSAEWADGVVVILGFDSAQDANRWYNSPDYARLIPLRQKSAVSRVYLLEGIH